MPVASMFVRDSRELRRLMARRDVSNRELARAAGYQSHAYMNRLVSGDINTITPQRAKAIARFLKVDLDTLFVSSPSTPGRRSVKGQRAS